MDSKDSAPKGHGPSQYLPKNENLSKNHEQQRNYNPQALDNLAQNISKRFRIPIKDIQLLLEFIKKNQENQITQLGEEERQNLLQEIGERLPGNKDTETLAQELLDAYESLKLGINKELTTFKLELTANTEEQIFPPSLPLSVKIKDRYITNPQSLGDHVMGFMFALGENGVQIGKFAGNLIWGALKSPYDFIQMLQKKGEYHPNTKL